MTNCSPHEEARNVHVVASCPLVILNGKHARIELGLNLHLCPNFEKLCKDIRKCQAMPFSRGVEEMP